MSSSSSLGDVFTFDTPEAVLRVLAAIRASEATSDQKNELRDLVLSYTNGGKDPSVQIQISQQLSSLGVKPSAVPTTTQPPVPHDFGSARSVPMFTPSKTAQVTTALIPNASSAPAPAPTPTPAAPAHVEPPTSVPPSAPATVPQAPTPVTPAPAVVAPVATPQVAAPVTPVPTPIVATPAPVAPTPAAPVQPAPVQQPTVSTTPEDSAALTRIREIKSLVNEKIGNPVNLVDIDNAVGREYMASLLDAMKQLNSGSGSVAAMDRLEIAYSSVENLLKEKDAQSAEIESPVSSPAAVSPVSETAPTPAAVNPPSTAVQSSPLIPTSNPVSPTPQTPEDVRTVEAESEPDLPHHPSIPSSDDTASDARWGNAAKQLDMATVPDPVVPKPVIPPATPAEPPVSPAIKAVPKPAIKAVPVKNLTDSTKPLKSLTDLPTAEQVNSSDSGDPLFAKDVTDGLNQLLSDWMLFKKSGLFGTGPKGIEHPLYAKIKDLQIPLLLAGRFEGATQEIKQSITDYMNGWRYEQGLIYVQGESFDHYLRRVIRHILDLQK